ncbi:MAG: hypothetical protein D6744_15100 [Planctomycetota bacterium]|nr:MAG: hypothetical protein D6744_15100 [Planctomycetota bacterium]
MVAAWVGGCTTGETGRVRVFAASGGFDLAPDTPPVSENATYSAAQKRITLEAAVNETVSLQLALRSEALLPGAYDLRITDFESAGGTIRAADAVTIYRVADVRTADFPAWYPAHTGRSIEPRDVPDLLIPWDAPRGGGPLRPGRDRNALAWIDVFVPPTTEPGEYRARLELAAGSRRPPAESLELHLRVLPIVIPSEPTLAIIARVDPRALLTDHFGWPRADAEQTLLLPDLASHDSARALVGDIMSLLHEHRLNPVLWASFPKFRAIGPRELEIEWDAYDALVGPWINGEGYSDRVGSLAWPLPVSSRYPNAQRNGGFESAQYARLLAAYVRACDAHFRERGWSDKAFVRLLPPQPLSDVLVDRIERALGILTQSEAAAPLAAHLPTGSLRALGWRGAPNVDLPQLGVWIPPAQWLSPRNARRVQALGARVWFQPDRPPYSGTLLRGAASGDVMCLGWLAYRYRTDGIWLENVCPSADDADRREASASAPLVYSGRPYGLPNRVLPSIRLKRLRRAAQDYELLRLLERGGAPLLAERTARQVARWGFTDACGDDLLSVRAAGWPANPEILRQARDLIRRELAGEFSSPETKAQAGGRAAWEQMMLRTAGVDALVSGARLESTESGLAAHIFLDADNRSESTVRGTWDLPNPPVGWSTPAPVEAVAAPLARVTRDLRVNLESTAFNIDGVYPFTARFNSEARGSIDVPGRLAVATAPLLDAPPTIDGDLSDWIVGAGNAAGDFRLTYDRLDGAARHNVPTLETQAYFCMDRERVYFAVRCQTRRGERPIWSADNRIAVAGAQPWGQDLVEILLSPDNNLSPAADDLYVLQVKPSGLLLARRGALTDPPMSRSEVWDARATVAVKLYADAWTVELAIPFAAFGPDALAGRVWGLNITRLDAHRGEYSSWSGARGHCYAPRRLGNLLLLRP